MEFHGLNKLTLLDFPKHLACTLFTGRCNLRCPFCHNADLVLAPDTQPFITEEKILAFLERRKDSLEGVCITGGEPTLQKDLLPFLKQCKDMGYLTKLDTNGTRPDVIKAALEEQLLDYIAMDIKNSPAQYAKTCGLSSVRFSAFEESVELIKSSGLPYEFRTTVTKELHTPQDIVEIGKWIQGADKYFIQPYRDSDLVIDRSCERHSDEELGALLAAAREYVPAAELRG